MEILHTIPRHRFGEIIALDNANYPSHMCHDSSISNWVDYDLYTVIMDNGRIVGYINFAPIKAEIYEQYRAGKIQEPDITAKHFASYTHGKIHDILVMGITIDEKHRGGNAIRTLLRGLADKIKRLQNDGVVFGRVLLDCVTNDGIKLAKHLGFNHIGKSQNGELYEGTVDNIVQMW